MAPPEGCPATEPAPSVLFQVRRLSMTEVPIAEETAARARADCFRPQRYLLASGAHEGVTGLVIAFDTTYTSIPAGDTVSPQGPGTHLWVAAVVEPDDALCHPRAGLHAVLLDAFSTQAPIVALLGRWSPGTRTATAPIHLDIVERDTAIVLDAHGPFGYRITSEYGLANQETSMQTMRLFGFANDHVTGTIDLHFPKRLRHHGHGIATKGGPHDPTFPPAAGLSQLEWAQGTDSYDVLACYTGTAHQTIRPPWQHVVPLDVD